LAIMALLPLALLAVEARISDRRKTYAFIIAALIAIVCFHLWTTKDLLHFSWVFLGGSAVLGLILLARSVLPGRLRGPIREGAH
jgi:hypothetical protein